MLNRLKDNYIKTFNVMNDKKKITDNVYFEEIQHKEALDELCAHLDSIGLKMPLPKYTFDEADTGTWRFADGVPKRDREKNIIGYREVINNNFKYGDLISFVN